MFLCWSLESIILKNSRPTLRLPKDRILSSRILTNRFGVLIFNSKTCFICLYIMTNRRTLTHYINFANKETQNLSTEKNHATIHWVRGSVSWLWNRATVKCESGLRIRQSVEYRMLWFVVTLEVEMNKCPFNFWKFLELYLQGLSNQMCLF